MRLKHDCGSVKYLLPFEDETAGKFFTKNV
jgi:hypothetical protein